MAFLRLSHVFALALPLFAARALAADQPLATSPGLYPQPVLTIDPGLHTATVRSASTDAAGRWVVTGSDDKTVRVWSLADGTLLRTIRLPTGLSNLGKVFAVAMSPDGALIAVGGWTRMSETDKQEQLYLFNRENGLLVRRIEGLPQTVGHINFSPDGSLLAVLFASGGLRVYARERDWAELARDNEYIGQSHRSSFAPDGRLVTTARDGKVRLYSSSIEGDIRPIGTAMLGGAPWDATFSPDGTRLAVGDADNASVSLLDGHTLTPLPRPDLSGIAGGSLSRVAWSKDGRTLFATGRFQTDGGLPILAWTDAGAGVRRALPAGQTLIMSLIPLPGDEFVVAAFDTWLARLHANGSARWEHGRFGADFRCQEHSPSVSGDGTVIEFGFACGGGDPARFDLAARALSPAPSHDGRTSLPRLYGLPLENSDDRKRPMLAGKRLQLEDGERALSFAVHPTGASFILGADWTLRAFRADGAPIWIQSVPGAASAVNITGDGRLVVAAYGDGTIRWHRMMDGVELLAFMPMRNRIDWVAWTPEGYYDATAGARGILRWHVNHGWDQPADSTAIEDVPSSYRPNVLSLVLQELETPRALGLAVDAEHRREVMRRTHSQVPPGAQLHLLTVGISAYNEDYAKHLRLNYAERDARDLASAIINTQDRLYAQVHPQMLADKYATKVGIMRALAVMQTGMERGSGNDLAVVHFSGHGALIDGKLYLLPHDVDARDSVGIKTGALSVDDLKGELLKLAKRGRVLVLLDACHAGATTMDGTALDVDATRLRTELAGANVTVLTSSSGQQPSREDPAWGHGAFTKVLLDALSDPAADIDRTGLISMSGLARYLAQHVPSLTGGAQTPGMEVRYEGTVFASSF